VASGALTADVAAEVERLRAQHADAVREKSAVESKNRRLAEKVVALEAEKTDLRRQLVEERREASCDGTSQVIRPTYSCPCLTDIRHPVDVPKSLDKFGIFPYLTRNVSPVLQTLQNIGDIEMRKQLHKLTFI
jgi:hypothetical protein